MDDFARAAQAFMEAHGQEYLSPEMALEDFVGHYNSQKQQESELDKLIDQATELIEIDPKRSKRLFEKAHKMAPDDLTVQLGLIAFEDSFTIVSSMKELEKKERAKWEKGPKVGWPNIDERPYLQFKFEYAHTLHGAYLLHQAVAEFEDLLRIETGDHQGARYELMVLYTELQDYASAKALFDANDHHKDDDQMLLPMMLIALYSGREQEAREHFNTLMEVNPYFGEFVEAILDPSGRQLDRLIEGLDPYFFEPWSLSSLTQCFIQLPDTMLGPYLNDWLTVAYTPHHQRIKEIEKEIKANEKEMNKIMQALENLNPGPALEGISGSALYALQDNRLTDFDKFKRKTEAEVAAIRGVGPKTMAQLKANGVTFKKSRKKKK